MFPRCCGQIWRGAPPARRRRACRAAPQAARRTCSIDRGTAAYRRRTIDAGPDGRAVLASDETAGGVGPAPGEGLLAGTPRHAAAALGHPCHARSPDAVAAAMDTGDG